MTGEEIAIIVGWIKNGWIIYFLFKSKFLRNVKIPDSSHQIFFEVAVFFCDNFVK
jgi:hypothetical protein